jgi:transcriptional accessory protein Tex/SPT6
MPGFPSVKRKRTRCPGLTTFLAVGSWRTARAAGEGEGILKVRVEMDEHDWREAVAAAEFQEDILSPFSDQLSLAIEDSAERLLLPAIKRDVRRELSEKADGHTINVFATNLRALLSRPPLAHQTLRSLVSVPVPI